MSTLRHADHIREHVAPRFDCDHCQNDTVRDLERGCPECPLTNARRQLYTGWPDYRGLTHDWLYYFDEAPPVEAFEREYAPLLSRVLDALSRVAEGRTSPDWPLDLAAAVAAYRAESAYVQREHHWRVMHPPAPPKG